MTDTTPSSNSPDSSATELAKAIAAVKARQWTDARVLLTALIKRDPTNAQAWLWYSATLRDPTDQEKCLNKVLSLHPNHPMAVQGIKLARKKIIENLLAKATRELDTGQHDLARDSLLALVERDETHLQAWEMLSQLALNAEEQEICFENILILDPDHRTARESLALLEQARLEADIDPTLAITSKDISEEELIAPTLAGDILGADYREKFTTVIPEPEPAPESAIEKRWKLFDDPLRCPYCTAMTHYEDKNCPVCNKPLWNRKLQQTERSRNLYMAFILQTASAGLLLCLPVALLVAVSFQMKLDGLNALFPVYFGGDSSLDTDVIQQALQILPRAYFWFSWLPAFGAAALALGIYLRWRPVYLLMLCGAIMGLISSLIALTRYAAIENIWVLISGLVGLAFSLFYTIFVIRLETDFSYRRTRILLEVDSGIKDGLMYLQRGQSYEAHGLWALAALHFRRASILSPKFIDGYRATANACIQLGEWDLAQSALEAALQLSPKDTRIISQLNEVKVHLTKSTS